MYIYTYVHNIYICVCIYIYTYLSMCVCVCMCTQTHTHTRTHTLSSAASPANTPLFESGFSPLKKKRDVWQAWTRCFRKAASPLWNTAPSSPSRARCLTPQFLNPNPKSWILNPNPECSFKRCTKFSLKDKVRPSALLLVLIICQH